MTFNGSPTITIPAGGMAVSDPAALAVPAGGDLTVSIFLPAQTISRVSFHNSAYQTNYLATGNVVGARTLTTPRKVTSWYFLKAVDVRTPGTTGAIVAFGDSITDGTGSTLNMNMRWPDVLARRLHADKKTAELSVLNEGIGGNRVLHDTTGPNALARFDRDVLAMSGVKYLVILESINDIGHAADPVKPYDVVTADDLIQGLAQMVERAHTHGIKVIGATLTPYAGAKYASPAGEAMRQAVNTWIRTTKTLDGVVDFDKATLDPAHPDAYKADFESGDHLHPKDAGYKAMGDAFDLKLFYPTK
jgi:lysophospholipase L1-like esterase